MKNNLTELARLIRYFILTSTTTAGSGHPSSSLSGVELMTALMFDGFFRFNITDPAYRNNDRLIFSKGHASPLFYSLWAAAGGIPAEELLTLRKLGSRLEGHPTMRFPFTEAATGSLGQGLSIGVGMALNAQLDKLSYRTYVLLGDSEMAEGSVWEACEIAAYYKLNNLIAIADINGLGQRGETMYGHHVEKYRKKVEAFGWKTIIIDGHSLTACAKAFTEALRVKDQPIMIIARTVKGKGVSFIENKNGWHGKPLSQDELKRALVEIGKVDTDIRGAITKPVKAKITNSKFQDTNNSQSPNYTIGEKISTRKAYGKALVAIGNQFPDMVVLDAEVGNSTYAELFKQAYPERFFEMFIAEQNMVGTALGLSRRGKIPFVSTFAAFFSRAYDQIRMSQYSDLPRRQAGANIKFCGSHAGVSIGEDGSSQMGLEDLAMFRTIHGSTVLYPSDGVSTEALVKAAAEHTGMVYIRTTRMETPVLYKPNESFRIGGSKVIKQSKKDVVTVIGAGITLHEALKAYDELHKEHIAIRVIDLYSVKPIDVKTLSKAAKETKAIITVEDHYPEGGIGEAVAAALGHTQTLVYSLAVKKMPQSGKPQELLDYEEISVGAIVRYVKKLRSHKITTLK